MLKSNTLFTIILLVSLFTPIFSPKQANALLMMPTNTGIEALVQAAFPDAPDMITIAKCESGFRQYDNNLNVLRNPRGNYIGIFQIDESLHAAFARSLGHDIYTIEGNIGYARYMYTQRGTTPWISCLKTPTQISAQQTSTSPETITANLKLNMIHPQVLTLQKKLNALGFSIATSGPGSPGYETNKYGPLTKQAVQKFQCAKKIVCEGTESTTGFGYVGPKTRAALNQ